MYIYPRIPNICCCLSNPRGCKVMCYQVCAVTILQEEISSTLQWASLKTFSLILRFTHSLAFPLSRRVCTHALYILYCYQYFLLKLPNIQTMLQNKDTFTCYGILQQTKEKRTIRFYIQCIVYIVIYIANCKRVSYCSFSGDCHLMTYIIIYFFTILVFWNL